MKRLMTAFAVLSLLLAATTAYGVPVDYNWDGDKNSNWQQLFGGNNWIEDANGYPGKNQADDTATSADSTNANPFYLAGRLNFDVASVTLDADTATGDLEFELRTGSVMTVTDSITLWGDDDANDSAALQFIAGTLAFDSAAFNLYGGDTADRKAVFDYDGGTISDNVDSMTMRGYSTIDAEVSFTNAGAFDVEVEANDAYDTFGTLDMGSATLTQSDHVTIQADQSAGYDATLDISAGTVNVASGKTTKIEGGGSADNAVATLKLSGATVDPADLYLSGGQSAVRRAFLDLDSGTLSAADSIKMEGVADVDSEISFANDGAFDVQVGASDAFDTFATLDMGAGTLTQSGHVTIKADQSAGYDATLDISAGTMNVASGKTTKIEGGGSADNAVATLKLSGTTLDPADLHLAGGLSAIREAFLDLDSGTLTSPDTFKVQGYGHVDSEISYTVAGSFTVDVDSNDDFDTLATLDMGSATLTGSGGLTVTADSTAANDAKVLVSAGTVDINGVVQLNSDDTFASQAIIEVSDNATFLPNSIDCNGGDSAGEEAELIFNENVTIQNASAPFTSFDGRCKVTLGANTTYNAKAVTLETTAVNLHVTGTNVTTSVFQSTSITDNSTNGVATMTFEGPLTVEDA